MVGFLADLKGVVTIIWTGGNIKVVIAIFTRLIFSRLWRDWWYWNTVEDRLLAYVKKTATQGDPASVLAAMHEYQQVEWTMLLEHNQRFKTEEIVKKAAPTVCLEMGCYIGVSAMATGRQIPAGGRLITVERRPHFAAIARELINFAGLDQVITVVTARAEDVIEVLRSEYSVDKLDFVFIDHCKWQYLPDLKLLEEKHLLRKGTVIMADDMLWPGAPDYLEYVENNSRYQTERFDCITPVFDAPDAMAISVYSGDNDSK